MAYIFVSFVYACSVVTRFMYDPLFMFVCVSFGQSHTSIALHWRLSTHKGEG